MLLRKFSKSFYSEGTALLSDEVSFHYFWGSFKKETSSPFPVAVGVKLNINTLVTLIAVFTGALIWGAAGMILFIPFVAILKVIADKLEPLKPLGTVLGQPK